MIYILIALTLFVLDWNIKNYIEENFKIGDKKDILNGKITLKKQYNRGFSLNFLEHKAELVKKVSAIVFALLVLVFLLILPQKKKHLKKLGLSICLGGAASNVWDRLKRGYVIDYFSFNIKPLKKIIFNLGDIFIFIGSIIIFAISLFDSKVNDSMGESTASQLAGLTNKIEE